MNQAVIFGGSGGIGQALAVQIAATGSHAQVWTGSRSGAVAAAGCKSFAFDLTDESSIVAAARLIGEAGRVDLVIVASGVLAADGMSPEKSYKMQTADAYSRAFAINAIGPGLIAKHMLPLLPRDERAVFAALSARVGSIADNRLGGWHAYRASKAALNMILRTIAIESARTHPQAVIVALHPGTVETALSVPFTGSGQRDVFTPVQAAEQLKRVVDGLAPGDSGGFFAWDGSAIPF